jgi:hypothetical protein
VKKNNKYILTYFILIIHNNYIKNGWPNHPFPIYRSKGFLMPPDSQRSTFGQGFHKSENWANPPLYLPALGRGGRRF